MAMADVREHFVKLACLAESLLEHSRDDKGAIILNALAKADGQQ